MYDQLLSLDISPAERSAYECLITNGPMTPPQLAKAAGLTRVNSYAALRGLAKKGLAKEKDVNKKRVYLPEPPTKLQELARHKSEEVRGQLLSVEALIPTLMNQYSLVSDQPGISRYDGLEGIKQIYEDSLRPPYPDESLVLRSIYDDNSIEPYILSYIKRRAKLGITNRTLSPSANYSSGKNDKDLLRQSRFYSKDQFSLPTEIAIYGDKVSLVSLRKDLIGTVIQSKDVAQTFRIIFELLWAQADTKS